MDRAQEIGVFRWRIVGEAADVSLSARERGALVRALAAGEYLGPDGRWVRVSRSPARSSPSATTASRVSGLPCKLTIVV